MKKYLTIEEKREMALRGERVPICMAEDSTIREYIVPIHGFIPSKKKHKKAKKLKV